MKKKKIIMYLIVAILLTMIAGLAIVLFTQKETIKVPDFSNGNLTQVKSWCATLEDQKCIIEYEYSDTVLENNIIYQSIKADEKLESDISFIISKGKDPRIEMLSVTDNLTRADVNKWVEDNGLLYVTYEEVYSQTVKEGNIVRIDSSEAEPTVDSQFTVYVSIGEEPINEDDEIEIESGKYVGLSLEDFKAKAEALKVTPVHKESRDEYSDTVKKGYIVWHGSGIYEVNENFSYGLSLGKKTEDDIEVLSGTYINLSEAEFIAKGKELGLSPNHNTSRDAYSDTIEKGKIVWHGSGSYVKDETFNYGLSLGKKETSETDDLEVLRTEYLGLTEAQFIEKANSLKLKPNHQTSRDAYSDTVEKGNIVWHGFGTYVENETFNYGLSLGKKSEGRNDVIVVEKGKYVGLTVSQFETKMKELGFESIVKTEVNEDYSDTVAAGNILWHGSGTYEINETSIRYSVSKGSKTPENIDNPTNTEKVTIDANSFINKTVNEFTSFCSENGLVAKYSSSYDSNSSTVTQGNIVKHDYGTVNKGTTVYYGLSKGIKTASIPSVGDLNNVWIQNPQSVSATKSILDSKLKTDKGFTNVTYNEQTNQDKTAGVVLSITVDGVSHTSAKSYGLDSQIVITICKGYE